MLTDIFNALGSNKSHYLTLLITLYTDRNIYKTNYAVYRMEDGVMVITYADNLVISLDIAKEMVEDRRQFSGSIPLPLLVDIRGLASVDTPSRKYFATPGAVENVPVAALLAKSLLSKLVGNIYITVDKPSLSIKLFTDHNKALTWLKKFRT